MNPLFELLRFKKEPIERTGSIFFKITIDKKLLLQLKRF